MKNYYEILEVDRKASTEVIDKAYKTLAKKYHPDLQDENNKNIYAEKMKEINEAYDVLSSDYKKTIYDEQLESQLEQRKTTGDEQQTQEKMQVGNTFSNMGKVLNNAINQAYNDAYKDAYIKDLNDRGYKIKYKHGLKYYIKFFFCILGVIFICFLIYQIPPVKSYFTGLYNGNVYFKAIVDIFKNTIQSGF